MKKSGLVKLNDRFTADERFRLVVEALALEDEEEAERLADSCPRETYRMLELAYTDRCRASMMVTMGLCLDLAPLLVMLRTIEIFREALPPIYNICEDEAVIAYVHGHKAGSRHAWEAADKRGDPPGWKEWEQGSEEDEDLVMEEELNRITTRLQEFRTRFVGLLEELEHYFIKEGHTTWEAFSNFCKQELGLEPEKLLKVWFEPMLPEIEKLGTRRDPPEVDPKELQEYEAAFKQLWTDMARLR